MKGNAIGIYKQTLTKEADDGTTHTFYGAYVKVGQIVELHQLSVTNIDKHGCALLIGYQQGEDDIIWLKKRDQANIYSCWMSGHMILVENERPVGRVVNPDGNDDLRFTAMGYIYKAE